MHPVAVFGVVLAAVVWTGVGLAAAAPAAPPAAAPATAKRPVTIDYHGVKVTDDYQWLEDWGKAEVKAWSEGQSMYTRGVLDALPSVKEIRARVTELQG